MTSEAFRLPLYEYQCPKCGRFELIRKFSDPALTTCPTCGSEVQKLFSAPAIQFKGTGWYITDYARKSDGKGGKDEAAKGEGAKADAGKAEGGKSEAAKSEGAKDSGTSSGEKATASSSVTASKGSGGSKA
ncbi:MAG TPA: zinc ribbon domain-containing protein [Vicinamibacteria bacterium]